MRRSVALYLVAKVTVTVGRSAAADQGPDWFKVFSTVAILLTLGFTAVLTAGLVNRLLDPRLTGIVGRSAVPRRDHVIVVGLGPVGFRLCGLLRDLAIPVAAEGLREDLNLTLRAGDGVDTSETRSLFHIGVVRDVYRIAGTAIAASALGYEAHEAFPYEGTLYLVDAGGTIEPFVPAVGGADAS